MTRVITVEPNALLRLGILQLLESMKLDIIIEGIGYSELFDHAPTQENVDLMLLSVPDVYDRVVTLVTTAQRRYAPTRILLLSSTQTLTFSLLNLPSIVAGYISKYSSHDVLTASVTLVLAGGKCFPLQDSSLGKESENDSQNSHAPDAPPRRRWYDKPSPLPQDLTANDTQPANLLAPKASSPQELHPSASGAGVISIRRGDAATLSPRLVASEAKMLGLTPRQLEVLAFLAEGYSIKEISRKLSISPATTKVHTQTLYQRLGVHSRHDAVHTAFSRGATLGRSRLKIARDEKRGF